MVIAYGIGALLDEDFRDSTTQYIFLGVVVTMIIVQIVLGA